MVPVAPSVASLTTRLNVNAEKIDPATGMLGPVPYWNFVDWTKEWPWDNGRHIGGVPDGADGMGTGTGGGPGDD